MTYTPSKKIFFATLGATFLFFLFFIFLLLSIFSQFEKLNEVVAQNVTYNANIEEALKVKKEMIDSAKERELLRQFFVQDGEEPYFIDALEQTGKLLGVKVQTESIAEGEETLQGFTSLHITLRYEGTWENSLFFLKKIEHLPQASSVEGVSMSLSPDEKSWSGTAAISVYKIASE